MNMLDVIIIILKRRKTFLYTITISLILMIIYTFFISPINYEVVSDVKIDGNILFSTNNNITSVNNISNQVKVDLVKIDDFEAVEYIQNNKNFFKDTGMFDFQSVINNLNSTKFLHSLINSNNFLHYLKNKNIIENINQVNIVMNAETLNIKITDTDKDKIKKTYISVLNEIPVYILEEVKLKIEQANNILKTNINNEQIKVDRLIEEYNLLKKQSNFNDIRKLNQGIEVLNSISNYSYNININYSISSKFDGLIENPIEPNITVIKTDYSGTELLNVYIIYIIIQLLSSLLLGLIFVFASEYFLLINKKIKAMKES
jgi:hypothetical protein